MASTSRNDDCSCGDNTAVSGVGIETTAAIRLLESAAILRAYHVVLDTLQADDDAAWGQHHDQHDYPYRAALHRLLLYVAESMDFERQPIAPSPLHDTGPVRQSVDRTRVDGSDGGR